MSFLFIVNSEKFLASQTPVERKHVWGKSGMAGSVENWGGWAVVQLGWLAWGMQTCWLGEEEDSVPSCSPNKADTTANPVLPMRQYREATCGDLLWMLSIGFVAFWKEQPGLSLCALLREKVFPSQVKKKLFSIFLANLNKLTCTVRKHERWWSGFPPPPSELVALDTGCEWERSRGGEGRGVRTQRKSQGELWL